jgi:hypothetical protein
VGVTFEEPGMPAEPLIAEAPGLERPAGPDAAMPSTAGSGVPSRKIIYEGEMDLVVSDTEAAAREAQALAREAGGYVAEMNAYRRGDTMIYDLTLRIPAEQFESVQERLRQMAVRVENARAGTQDVSDQYVDLEARLRTLQATEAELLALLQRTEEQGGDVEDIMAIYDRLTQIRSDIEVLQGQINRLDRQVAYATLRVHLEPHILTEPIKPEINWSELIHSSVNTLMNLLTGLVALAIRFLIIVVPLLVLLLLPLAGVVWVLIRWQRRRHRAP